jgi:hypothetical protein
MVQNFGQNFFFQLAKVSPNLVTLVGAGSRFFFVDTQPTDRQNVDYQIEAAKIKPSLCNYLSLTPAMGCQAASTFWWSQMVL